MNEWDQIKNLITREQGNQEGAFITNIDIEAYVHKLQNKAEIVTYADNGQCVGFLAFYCNSTEYESSFISLLLIAPEYRGKHIAKNLIDSVISITKSRGFSWCSLEVKKNNHAAIRLYESKGFIVHKELEQTFIMRKNLL